MLMIFILGIIFNLLAVISLYRFPDVYTRLHGSALCTTLGSFFVYLAAIIYVIQRFGSQEITLLSFHTVFIFIMLLITVSTGSHAIARAAYKSGIMPKYAIVDKLGEKND